MNAEVMKNAVHLLRSLRASELTATQASALKPWLAKRHQGNHDARYGETLESGAASAIPKLPDTSILDPQSANFSPAGGPNGLEQVPSNHTRKPRWSPPPLSSSESEDEGQHPTVAPKDTPALSKPTRLLPSPPRLTLPKPKENLPARTCSAAKGRRVATTARKRETQLPKPNASVTDRDPRRSASSVRCPFLIPFSILSNTQEVVEVSAVKIKREHSSIDDSPDQNSSYKIEELKVSPATYKHRYTTEEVRYAGKARTFGSRNQNA